MVAVCHYVLQFPRPRHCLGEEGKSYPWHGLCGFQKATHCKPDRRERHLCRWQQLKVHAVVEGVSSGEENKTSLDRRIIRQDFPKEQSGKGWKGLTEEAVGH